MEVKRWHFWIPPMERNFKLTSGRIYMKNLLKMLLNISYWNCVYVHTCGCTASWSPEQQTGAVQGTSLSESKATMAVHPLTNSLHKFWFAAYHCNPCIRQTYLMQIDCFTQELESKSDPYTLATLPRPMKGRKVEVRPDCFQLQKNHL